LPPSPQGLPRTGGHCQSCGRLVITAVEGLFTNPQRGGAQRFCNHACRQRAYRRRRAGAPEDAPAQYTGGRRRGLKGGAE